MSQQNSAQWWLDQIRKSELPAIILSPEAYETVLQVVNDDLRSISGLNTQSVTRYIARPDMALPSSSALFIVNGSLVLTALEESSTQESQKSASEVSKSPSDGEEI